MFAYIDELSALSADGYAEAQSAAAGESERLRRRLAALLLDPDADEAAVRVAAADAGWDPPASDRGPGLGAAAAGRLRARLPPSTLVAESGDDGGGGVALLADPDAPGLAPRLERAARRERASCSGRRST